MEINKVVELKKEIFSICSVVLPAVDGILSTLGYDIEALGEKALGFVADVKSKKCFVVFPRLKLSLWMDKVELADVEYEAQLGNQEFQSLLPQDQGLVSLHPAWFAWKLAKVLPVNAFLNFESDQLFEVWDSFTLGNLEDYYQGPTDISVIHLSFGVDEIYPQTQQLLVDLFGEKLLFVRYLPAGLHKIETSLYLRD